MGNFVGCSGILKSVFVRIQIPFADNTDKYISKKSFSCKPTKKLNSVTKKTTILYVFDKKFSKTRLSKFLKPGSLHFVNDCFKN